MKKITTFFLAGAAFAALSAAFVACNTPGNQGGKSDEPEMIGLLPLSTSDLPEEVSAFFEEHLPPVSGIKSDCFFVGEDGDKCLMIDSGEELKKILHSPIELPNIDFGDHTLIIGQQVVPTTSFSIMSQNIDVGSEAITLNLTVKTPEAYYAALSHLYYWGLYPKLDNNAIDVNVIYEK